MTAIPKHWPITTPFFELPHDEKTTKLAYKLNTNGITQLECHMFFPIRPCEELLIATMLEFFTFHPLTQMNAKFNIEPVKIGDIQLMWCRFPKEFKDTCERAGALFDMTMKTKSVGMLFENTSIKFPTAANVLWFVGERCDDPDVISRKCTRITAYGNSMHRLGID